MDLPFGGSSSFGQVKKTKYDYVVLVFWLNKTKIEIHMCHIFRIPVPYHMIAISLASFAIPLSLGVLFKYKKAQLADRIAFMLSRPFFLLCLVLIPTIAMSQSLFVFYLLTWRHAFSGFLVGMLKRRD